MAGASTQWKYDACGKVVTHKKSIACHKKLYSKCSTELACSNCSKSFKLKENLRRQVKSCFVKEKKVFQCSLCLKQSRLSWFLSRHAKTHQNKKSVK